MKESNITAQFRLPASIVKEMEREAKQGNFYNISVYLLKQLQDAKYWQRTLKIAMDEKLIDNFKAYSVFEVTIENMVEWFKSLSLKQQEGIVAIMTEVKAGRWIEKNAD